MFSCAILAFSLAGSASAAEKPRAVQVELDGKTVDFGSDIVFTKGKSYVEYAALFKLLGYNSDLDPSTKAIYAKKDETEIEIYIDGDIAIVNGMTVASTGEVLRRDGRTLIGLRFAGALTNHAVDWINPSKKISITYTGPTDAEKAAIHNVFNKMLLVEAAGDSEGLSGLMSEDTVMDISNVMERWKTSRTKTNIESFAIQSYSDTVAVVNLVENTAKVSGDFFPDNLSKTRYTLHKDKAGNWKIYSIEVLAQQLTNIPGLFEQKATVSDADKTAMNKLFADQVKAANEKNVAAYLATLVDFAEKDQLKGTLDQLFATTTFKITTENLVVVQYNGSDKATLLISMLTEQESGGVSSKTRSIVLNEAKKIDGKWLLQAEASILSNEQL